MLSAPLTADTTYARFVGLIVFPRLVVGWALTLYPPLGTALDVPRPLALKLTRWPLTVMRGLAERGRPTTLIVIRESLRTRLSDSPALVTAGDSLRSGVSSRAVVSWRLPRSAGISIADTGVTPRSKPLPSATATPMCTPRMTAPDHTGLRGGHPGRLRPP